MMSELVILFPPSLWLPLSQAVNIGESSDFSIPEEFSEEERMWWRQLVAGGGAGAGEDRETQCYPMTATSNTSRFNLYTYTPILY